MDTTTEQTVRSPPQQQEPDPKKTKMSSTTTTTSDDEDEQTAVTVNTTSTEPTKKKRYKRRKIAIFFAYCGVGYQGMQKNPGAKTIEGEMEQALYLSGAVPEHDKYNPRRYDWARSARTDKGVSAVGQVVSGRFYIDPPGLIQRLNEKLPGQIRIFGFKRTTSAFNAKKFCDRRRYVYLIPVFALDPCCHRDRESVLASVGSGVELVKCLHCSERGRKVEGVMGKRTFGSKKDGANGDSSVRSEVKNEIVMETKEENMIPAGNCHAIHNSEVQTETAIESKVENMVSAENGVAEALNSESRTLVTQSDNGNAVVNAEVKKENEDVEESVALTDDGVAKIVDQAKVCTLNKGSDANDGVAVKVEIDINKDEKQQPVKQSSFFGYGEEEKERFNRILKYYVGTHNFHNFTTRTKAEDPAAKRYIISFTANTTVTVEGIEFVKCEVVGQSFMLHQIRKMIGLAVAIMRNLAPESLIETAYRKDVNINVPMAPEVGLYLDECFFTSYNQKWKDTHEELSMKAYEEEAEDFKMKYIYSHIGSTEHKEGVVALWLHSLNYRNYPDLRFTAAGETTEVKETVEANVGEIPLDNGAGGENRE